MSRPITLKTTELFQQGKYRNFRKGQLYHDPRINQMNGQKDFLVITNSENDLKFLNDYLKNALEHYPSEPYNMFTTGQDKNGESMVGLYWIDGDHADPVRCAMILCRAGAEEAILELVDQWCGAEDAEPEVEPSTVAGDVSRPKLGLHSLGKYKTN